MQNISLFDSGDCRFTFSDHFTFGEEFGDDVFIGNDQFSYQNNFLNRAAVTFLKCLLLHLLTITFLFDCYCNSDFYCTCETIDDPISCIEMVEYGNEDIGQICEKTLCFLF